MYTPINGYTKATIIETLKRHVRDARCADEEGACLYRHPKDPAWSCAVGAFIPRHFVGDVWDPWLSVSGLLNSYTLLREHMPLVDDALVELQLIHDTTEEPESALERCLEWVEQNVQDPL